MNDCLFCRIVAGELPCFQIYEDTNYVAFLDIYPYGEGHILVIPKQHYTWVWDVPDLGTYMDVCRKIALHLKEKLHTQATYVSIFGEQVPHAHIHLIPALSPTQKKLGDAFGKLRSEKIDSQYAQKLTDLLKLSPS